MNENPRTELDVVSDSDRSGVLDETESRQLTELDQLREFLGNPERILGFPVEALFRLDILTKNYPSVFYPTKNNWNKRYGLEELIDPQQPGHPFSNLVGYSFAETQRLKLKYPDSLAIAQAEVGLAIQAYCFLAALLLRKVGKQALITPVAHDHGALTLSQLFEKLSTFQSQVSQAIVELEKQSEINTTWIPISESDTNHSIVKLALLVRLKEQASLGDTISWNEISKFLDQVVEYVPIDTDENFKTVVSGAVLNTTNSGLHTVSFRIREYLCTTILGLSGVFQFDQILELLRAKETRKQAEIRKEEARQRANTKLERLRGTGNLEGKSLLPQPPEGVDVIGWLSQQSWYRERIIVGAARQADASELQRAYPKHQFLFEKRYYEITLKKAEKMEKQNPGIIKLLLRFGITQLARYREDDLIAMYHFVLSEKNDSKNQPYYLHLSSAHDHNNSILLNGREFFDVYRTTGEIAPIFCEFNSPLELYKLLIFVVSITAENPRSVMIHSHGYRGGIAYPNPITNRMVDLVSERFLCLTKGDGRISVVLEACHGADVAEDGNSFAAQIHKLGIRVFAPEWLSQGIKSIQVDPEGYVTHLEFKAIGTKLFNHHIH